MRKKIYTIVLIFISLSYLAQGQAELELFRERKIPSFIPASPDAAGIAKLAEINANNYSGLLNISIPIYTIKLNKKQLPVSLGYNSTGVKVEEYAASTGMHWALNAGGVITRTIRGLPDDGPSGYLSQAALGSLGSMSIGSMVDLYVRDQMSTSDKELFEREAANGNIDTEPDIYSYSFPGGSGKFFITPTNKIISIPHDAIKIVKETSGGFSITDTYGNRYEFATGESTFSYTQVYNGETNTTTSQINPEQLINSWHLSRILTAYNEEVTFQYTTTEIEPSYNAHQARYWLAESNFPSCCINSTSPFLSQYTVRTTTIQEIDQKKIQKIIFPDGEIEFDYSLARTDLPGDFALTSITVKNKLRSLAEFELEYAYYANRLFLETVQEVNPNTSIPPYTIEYNNPSGLPSRTSYSQDYWGYYNGASNPSLIPAGPNNFGSGFVFFPPILGDADREPDPAKMAYGIISKITYPTGGYTEFQFEPNTYSKIGNTDVSEPSYTITENEISAVGNTIGSPVYSSTFEIEFHQEVTIDYNVYGNATSVRLLRIEGGVEHWEYSILGNNTTVQSGSTTRALQPGTYQLRAFNYEEEFDAEISVEYQSRTVSGVINEKTGGGLRIKTISDYDHITSNTNVQDFIYKSSLSDTKSSGVLLEFPVYEYFQQTFRIQVCPLDGTEAINCEIGGNYYVKMSNPAVSLPVTYGSYVGYKGVIVRNNLQNEEGYIVRTFRSPDDFPDQTFSGFPFTHAISKDVKRGQTAEEKVYDNQDEKVSETLDQYTNQNYVIQHNTDWVAAGANVGYLERHPMYPDLDVFVSKIYFLFSEFTNPTLHTEIVRGQSGNQLTSQRTIFYDNISHLFPTRVENLNSKGDKIITYNVYPPDYSADNSFIEEMKEKNILANIVESVQVLDVNGTKTIKSGTIIEYDLDNPAVPERVYKIETKAPIGLQNFKFSNQLTGALPFSASPPETFQKDPRYEEFLHVVATDSKGNILEQRKEFNHPLSYLWDYNFRYPIANIVNGSQDEIAYTSFEADGTGNWVVTGSARDNTDGITGSSCYQLVNGGIMKDNLDPQTLYTISYWTKNSGAFSISGTQGSPVEVRSVDGWTCFMHNITGVSQITLNGNGLIDELRLHPKDAQITSYTYEPMVGMTSECDPINNIIYYEYDEFNRLKLIRDQDKNILKRYDYQFRQIVQ